MIADLHAHYAMHLVGRGGSIWKLLRTKRGRARLRDRGRALLVGLASRFGNYRSPFSGPRVTMKSLRAGRVGVALSVVYSFFDELELGEPYPAPPKRGYIDSVLGQLDLVEEDLAKNHKDTAMVVRGPDQLPDAFDDERVGFVHCVEGGFCLGSTPAEVSEAVKTLAQRGVAYITLAHLVWRRVATNANAIPFIPDGLYRRLFPQPDEGLSDLGRAAVTAMLREGILVDLSHMSDRSVADTLDLLDQLDGAKTQPVFASHGCFRFGSQEYGVDEPTLRRIAERRGVVGLIMAQHQLRDGVPRQPGRGFEASIGVIRAHVDQIAKITRSHDHVAIGSDFDGFIKPTMAGLQSMADMARLEEALIREYGETKAELICSGNALRVLRAGWGRKLPV
ncbi:MAG: rane dipeptidase [Thermoleophilaceae bacterium]|nr:rane dipeptidase [Thermoleophilaceae bacterium]